jgi:hypothetical protein
VREGGREGIKVRRHVVSYQRMQAGSNRWIRRERERRHEEERKEGRTIEYQREYNTYAMEMPANAPKWPGMSSRHFWALLILRLC